MPDIYEINTFLKKILDPTTINDYCINGIQIENNKNINKIAFSVDASIASLEKAIKINSDLLIVHHGILWNTVLPIKGNLKERIYLLLNNNIGLIAYHLPLDIHHEYGNNIQILKKISKNINFKRLKNNISPFGYNRGIAVGWQIDFKSPKTIYEIYSSLNIEEKNIKYLNFGTKEIKKIAVISGSGGHYFNEVISNKIDLFITGDSAHVLFHEAKENKINILFAGHYFTETFGIIAIEKIIKKEFKIETTFIDIPTGL